MEEVRITVRLPKPIYDALKRASQMEQRSLNGQLVVALAKALGVKPAELTKP